MTRPVKSAVQVQQDDALVDRESLRSIWHIAVADANSARDRFAEAEQLGSPTRIAETHEAMDAASDAADRAFRNFKASL